MASVQYAHPAKAPRQGWKRYAAFWARNEELSLLLILAIVVGFFLYAEPSSRQRKVYWDLLWEVSPTLIAAVGIAMLMLAAQFDLSIGSMLAFTGVATVTAMNKTDSMWLGILVGLATGLLIGCLNGFLVTYVRMQSLMTTLGMMFALRGLVYTYTNKTPVIDENQFTQFTRLWFGKVGPVRTPVILAFILIAIAWFVLTQTEYGRNIYAIGGNEQAARVSGIPVRRILFSLFVISSCCAAISGLLIAAQTDTGYFDAGVQGFELTVIAAVVLGGVSMSGGQGNILSAALAVLILGMIGKGMRLMGIHTTQQLLVIGVVMLAAVYFHRVRRRWAVRLRNEGY
ncbi:MAG: ABC transporter permease [Thermomicrobiales bacterium]|nr:ABC transporter permease [Thermomicrobiales bacterium]MCO5220944.1 ABC transporter permease [Thermomicrobiales bacterium]